MAEKTPQRPPSAPPPPPENFNYAVYKVKRKQRRQNSRKSAGNNYTFGPGELYDTISVGSMQQRCPSKSLVRVLLNCVLLAFVLSALLLALGVMCQLEVGSFCPQQSALWSGVFFALNALLGLVTVRRGLANIDLYTAHFLTSLFGIGIAAGSFYLAYQNWSASIGPDPKSRLFEECVVRDFCRYVNNPMAYQEPRQKFVKCAYDLRLGLTLNALQALIATALGLIQTISAVLCLVLRCKARRVLLPTI